MLPGHRRIFEKKCGFKLLTIRKAFKTHHSLIKPTLRSAVSTVRRVIQEPLTGFKRESSEVLYYTLEKAEFQAFTDTLPQNLGLTSLLWTDFKMYLLQPWDSQNEQWFKWRTTHVTSQCERRTKKTALYLGRSSCWLCSIQYHLRKYIHQSYQRSQ